MEHTSQHDAQHDTSTMAVASELSPGPRLVMMSRSWMARATCCCVSDIVPRR